MKPAFFLLSLSIALLVAGCLVGSLPASVIMFYVAGCSLVLSAAYARNRPGIWGKDSRGRLHPLSLILFAPLHLINQVNYQFMRLGPQRVAVAEVVPGLFLGRRLARSESQLPGRLRFASVLDLTSEFPEPGFVSQGRNYLCVPVLDRTAPTHPQLRQALDYLRNALPAGPVYVHCAFGLSRSATVVAAHLLATGAESTLESALERVAAVRPGVFFTSDQRRRLQEIQRAMQAGGRETIAKS
jgi:hypothetical protein